MQELQAPKGKVLVVGSDGKVYLKDKEPSGKKSSKKDSSPSSRIKLSHLIAIIIIIWLLYKSGFFRVTKTGIEWGNFKKQINIEQIIQ
jgi:hypothetical protein